MRPSVTRNCGAGTCMRNEDVTDERVKVGAEVVVNVIVAK